MPALNIIQIHTQIIRIFFKNDAALKGISRETIDMMVYPTLIIKFIKSRDTQAQSSIIVVEIQLICNVAYNEFFHSLVLCQWIAVNICNNGNLS